MSFSPLADVQPRESPFPHFVALQSFPWEVADAAYEWLDANAPWRRHATNFFDQFECSMTSPRLPPLLHANLVSSATLRSLRRRMEDLFSVSLADVFTVTGHRLVPGQGIGVHTDRPDPGQEHYRLVVHLGPTGADSGGGHLMFFNGERYDDLACAFRSVHNTAVGFELSRRSFHAVGEVSSGVRYTLVYSFWRADDADKIEPPGMHLEQLERQNRWNPSPAPHARSGRVFNELVQVLVEAGAASTPRTEAALLPDFVETYELLQRWRHGDTVCLAGLFHGVYGSALSADPLIALNQRYRVCEAIGARAEELVYACGAADYETLQQALQHDDPSLIEDRWRRAPLGVDRHTMAVLATLILAGRVARHPRVKPAAHEWADEKRLAALAEPYLDEELRRALRRIYG